MIFIYIVCGLLLLILAVYLLNKKQNVSSSIKALKLKQKEAEDMNRELDELIIQLDELNEPIDKVNRASKKVLKFFSK